MIRRQKLCVRALCPGDTITWHVDEYGENGFFSCDVCGAIHEEEPAPPEYKGQTFMRDADACVCVGGARCNASKHWWEK